MKIFWNIFKKLWQVFQQIISTLNPFTKSPNTNCGLIENICPHCEVAISEATADAIVSMLLERVKEVKVTHPEMAGELYLQINNIYKGKWYVKYSQLMLDFKDEINEIKY